MLKGELLDEAEGVLLGVSGAVDALAGLAKCLDGSVRSGVKGSDSPRAIVLARNSFVGAVKVAAV